MPYHSPHPQHLLTPYKLLQPQLQPCSPTHHCRSAVEVEEEEAAEEEEAVEEEEVEAVAVEVAVVEAAVVVEEDHLVAHLLHKPLLHQLLPPITTAKD